MSDSRGIPIICGPTASGKTALTISLAKHFPIEVINADSRQIVRYLDIGTAKPDAAELQQVPIHLINLVEPGERYNAFRFIDDADQCIAGLLERGSVPVVAGGTGLYIRALTEGVVEIDSDGLEIRARLEREMEDRGPEFMHDKLSRIDPLEAAQVHPNNRIRVIRALEIYYQTGHCKSELAVTGAYKKGMYSYACFRLMPSREWLYERINRRVDKMMADGWVEEVEQLRDQGMADAVRRSRVIGYSELLDYLVGKLSFDEAQAVIKQNTRRYAKRQYTWLRHQIDGPVADSADELMAVLTEHISAWK